MTDYKFSNLLGTIYSKGNLEFSPDGFTVISPVGNRITLYDLKDHISRTLPVEATVNFTSITLSPNGLVLITGNEIGEVHVISLVSQSVLHVLKPGGNIRMVKYSPDGTLFAVAKEDVVLVYAAPGLEAVFNPFELRRSISDVRDIVSLEWSFDSRLIAVSSALGLNHIYPLVKFTNFKAVTLASNNEGSVRSFFLENSYNFYSISKNAVLRQWNCSEDPAKFIVQSKLVDDDDLTQLDDDDVALSPSKKKVECDTSSITSTSAGISIKIEHTWIRFKVEQKFYYNELFKKGDKRPPVSSIEYNKKTKLLVTGFHGSFFLHEMPDFNLIQSLKISDVAISTITLNPTSDWIAFGCPSLGQLLVWEWQSETYIMKQQGHFDMMECFEYSPSGLYIATGGLDGKVKMWNTQNSFCFVTFDEHTAAVTGIVFTQKGKAVISSSADGTVRAFDLKRYRNFRTFTSPRPVQFSCVSVDCSGQLVVAGGKNDFNLFLWSMQTGHLLEILTGHEASIESVKFSPSSESSRLASVSTDKTLKIWESVGSNGAHENILLNSEGTCLAFSPDGLQVAVGTLDGNLSFFGSEGGNQQGSINGRLHLHAGRAVTDKTTAEKSRMAKQFRTLAYSPDGKLLLAAGPAKNICMYDTKRQHLIGTYQVSKNHSFDGLEGFINHRKLTEFGNLDLVEDRDNADKLALPGVRKGDMASRTYRNELRITCVRFSPAGRTWAATTTEGLLVYSSELSKVFDPIGAGEDVTPDNIKLSIKKGNEFDRAIMMALRLNLAEYIKLAVESVKIDLVEFIAKELPFKYVKLLLRFVGNEIKNTRRVELYLAWIENLLRHHLWDIKAQVDEVAPVLNDLKKNVETTEEDIVMIQDNCSAVQFILNLSKLEKMSIKEEEMPSDSEDVKVFQFEDSPMSEDSD